MIMWPFRKPKTMQKELDAAVDKLEELIGNFKKIGYCPPETIQILFGLARSIGKMQKELDEEKEFNRRYYHR